MTSANRIDAHKETALAALDPDRGLTIEETRQSLAAKGLIFAFGTLQPFFRRYNNVNGMTSSIMGATRSVYRLRLAVYANKRAFDSRWAPSGNYLYRALNNLSYDRTWVTTAIRRRGLPGCR